MISDSAAMERLTGRSIEEQPVRICPECGKQITGFQMEGFIPDDGIDYLGGVHSHCADKLQLLGRVRQYVEKQGPLNEDDVLRLIDAAQGEQMV